MNEFIQIKGDVQRITEYSDGRIEIVEFPNTILKKGREAMASSLANDFGASYPYFIHRMLFGDGGTVDGQTKYVDTHRNGLFGLTRATKPVISRVDTNIPSRVVFTSVLAFDDANGYALNEMALQMSNSDLYSMVTFADINKTSDMQITYNWIISMI